ncbi:hypothetical protein Barb4_01449 [Bacteroidales bacterium Barb4]|nr:hypothetical protein Barb4_01449 [Bacteroidales bacterium Barb4]
MALNFSTVNFVSILFRFYKKQSLKYVCHLFERGAEHFRDKLNKNFSSRIHTPFTSCERLYTLLQEAQPAFRNS